MPIPRPSPEPHGSRRRSEWASRIIQYMIFHTSDARNDPGKADSYALAPAQRPRSPGLHRANLAIGFGNRPDAEVVRYMHCLPVTPKYGCHISERTKGGAPDPFDRKPMPRPGPVTVPDPKQPSQMVLDRECGDSRSAAIRSERTRGSHSTCETNPRQATPKGLPRQSPRRRTGAAGPQSHRSPPGWRCTGVRR